jgi:ATP phosphoribosyltransferase
LSVASRHDFDYQQNIKQGSRLQVATKYVEQAREHFAKKGVHVDIIKLYGSMELAPLVGLADVIVDVVSSGNTLRENHLKEVEMIHPIASYLIANKASYHTKFKKMEPILTAFASQLL